MFKDSFATVFNDKHKVLVIFSHPDDAEIFAGGTIARLLASGKEVCVVKMTLGSKGSRDLKITEKALSEQRLREDTKAMEILGIKKENNIYLDFNDGEIENNLQSIEKVVKVIRKVRPDIVITHNPENKIIRWDKSTCWINHRDHLATGQLVVDASYPYSRDILFFPEHFRDSDLQSHVVTEFLFVDYYDHPDTIAIDVTDFTNVKTSALSAHNSQYPLDKAKESTEFFTKIDDSDRNFERFRYVVAD